MATTFTDWLKNKLVRMVSIQSATSAGEADLTAFAWSGSQLRVYIIGEPIRTRSLKRTIQDATDIGVNILFLVDIRLLGESGKRITPQDWMLALHEITHERIYAFRINDGSAEILPIHLEEISGSGDRKLWYGPIVDFERIRFYRTSVKQPRSIRGSWLVADFGNHAFWRNNDYRRHHATHKHTYTRDTEWQTWSTGGTWQTNERSKDYANNRTKSPLKARLDECYELLGVQPTATQNEVKRAFRKKAIAVHPDTSKLPQEQAEAAFRALNAAYDYIKAARGWT